LALLAAASTAALWFFVLREPTPASADEALDRARAILDEPSPSHRRAAKLCLVAARMAEDETVLAEAFVTLHDRVEEPYRLRALLDGLEDSAPRVREGAAIILGSLGDEEATDALVTALGDVEAVVAAAAALALQQIHSKRPNILIHLIGRSPTLVRKHGSLAMVNLSDARMEDPLFEALVDDDVYVRERAFEILVVLYGRSRECPPAAKGAAIRGLRDKSGAVRRRAARFLNTCADADVVEPLAEALRDETEVNTRRQMLETLQNVRRPSNR